LDFKNEVRRLGLFPYTNISFDETLLEGLKRSTYIQESDSPSSVG